MCFVCGVFLSTPLYSFGQSSQTESKISLPKATSETEDLADILFICFRQGLPASEIILQGSFGEIKTDTSGVAKIRVAASTIKVYVPELQRHIDVKAISGEQTQVVINLFEAKNLNPAQIDVPQSKNANLPDESGQNSRSIIVRAIDDSTSKPITAASVLIAGQSQTHPTNENGEVTINLPLNSTMVSVFHDRYQTLSLTPQTADSSKRLYEFRLKAQSAELEEVVVLAPKVQGSVSALVEFRRNTSTVTDVLGAEQMSRTGDGDAAASLRRVTGLTLVGGKYVFIRGLGDRYSGVQFNGFALPSPEPMRRVVPLDLFPTAILENIIVQKSYSPDISGEFGGGIIQLNSRSLPETFFFRSQISQTLFDGSGSPSYRGGSMDWLGIDDGQRKMPGAIREIFASGKKLERTKPGVENGVSEEDLVRMGQSLNNNYNITAANNTPLPAFNIATGNRWNVSGLKVGAAVGTLYNQSLDWVRRENYNYIIGRGGRLETEMQRTTEFTDVETKLGGTLDVGFKYQKRHELTLNTTLLRHTNRFTQKEIRKISGDSNVYLTDTLDWTERKLLARQLKLKNEWEGLLERPIQTQIRFGQSEATRNNPDRRDVSFTEAFGVRRLRSGSEGNRRTFSDLSDTSQELGADVKMPFVSSSSREWISFKTGVASFTKSRKSDIFRLYFNPEFTQNNSPVSPSDSAEKHFARENIGPGRYMLQSLSDAADSYRGEQKVFAHYQMLQLDPVDEWSFQIGMRTEDSVQNVKTFLYFNPDNPNSQTTVRMKNVLPAYSLTYKPTANLRGRIAYSETVARPDFRELSDVMFVDDETGNNILGNPNLQGTVIRNIDHRWEYYYSSDEFSSVGLFYKHFTNPIEVTFLSGVNRIQSFENSKAATNYGLEFENRVGLRHLHRDFRRLTFVSNLAFVESNIELNQNNLSVQTTQSRPLQGQSPYIVNLQLLYDKPLWGFNCGVLYNLVGRRIVEVGTNGIPDTYELPYPEVDLVATQTVAKNMRLNFRARNVLDPDIEFVKGESIVQSSRRGRFVTVGLNASF